METVEEYYAGPPDQSSGLKTAWDPNPLPQERSFPVDDDHPFRSMATTVDGRDGGQGGQNGVIRGIMAQLKDMRHGSAH